MLLVGITGGMGSGKTTVCKIFELLGIPVYYADTEAKKLYDSNSDLKKKIIQNFGGELYKTGKFDKNMMSRIVFGHSEKLNLLNQLVHPIVKNETANWVKNQKSPYVMKEAALLIESGNATQMDEVILVTAPLQTRIDRIVQRDALHRNEILQRIGAQMPDEEKLKYAGHLIINDEEHLLIPQVMQLHHYLLEKAKVAN